MEFSKISSPSLRDLFVEQLEHLILSGKLKIGEKLPPERQLAEMMQVSRAVVNGGLGELERKGFLVVKPRIGTFVADYRRKGTLDTLMAIMKYNGGRLRNEEIRSILEVRIALDTLAAQLCIDRISDEEVELLREKKERIRETDSITEASQAAFEFQHEFALLSHNTLIPLIFQSFRTPVSTLWERFCTLYGIPALYENTHTLWTFIRDRDTDGAIEWIQASIGNTIDGSRKIYYD
ncbi:FadR family transcriptional regulator [Clostridium sp. AF19-22AC]|mgnify:CR=1 FL=1|jgi:GntR family transcriptional repressor for pyruvate dehydrogenase complex|uniref:DNA-binding FadR family transcriptional regulator n=1 Tax=Faecalicatena orotica TaxID=1544 RepID=A0A2Y9BEI8_9FIRM|nr:MULTISPECIES: GntR family transcriptional regulator [Clostridia]PWJ31515.1 DNA-binding FadR family transcriptional regulator [Faecalicatena orotica]RHR20596.1 FadR family transcriptional regulator [Clostridium sp. AF19-22AC]SSA54723.1 DNA-binding transcriptional regulator, FadR family [Faecalicatena orotica]